MSITGPVSFNGLVSGLNTQAIINAEMSVYEQPLNALKSQASTVSGQISDYQALNTQLLALQQAADLLSAPSAFDQAFSTASTDASVASASVTSGAQAGTVTFAVDQLATGSTQISAGTVASTGDVVTSGDLLIGTGGAALGIASFGGSTGLSAGAHTIDVTQASTGATVTAGTPVTGTVTITSANDQLNVTVGGTTQVVVLALGTYTASELAQAVAQAAGGTLTAKVGSGGLLSISTTEQGSTASLQVTGGSALGALGLAAGGVVNGTDGVVSVDGVATTVTDIAGSGTTAVTLATAGGGTIIANMTGGLNLGSMTATNLAVGDGSLASVVSAINGAGLGITANALNVGTNSYALDLSSNGTGTAGATTVDTQAFATSGLGVLNTTTAAQNAQVSIGGPGGYLVTSQSNAVTGLLPGITVNLAQVSTTPVTISVTPDATSVVSNVQALVAAANQVLSTISTDTAYNAQTGVAGPLNGSWQLGALAQHVLAIVGHAVGTSGSGSDGTSGESAGLAITSQGTVTFNQTAFLAAYAKNPSAVQAMFTEGGTFAPASPTYAGQVNVSGSTDGTTPGTYAVTISQSASQAVDTGSATWAATTTTLAQAETYTVTSGSNTATYAATAGESVSSVINGLNTALAGAGIATSAALVGSAGAYQVQLASAGYGSAATFTVAASGADQLGLTAAGTTFTGTDVAGTIDGQTATGSGQSLSLPSGSDPASGLVLQITTPGITASTNLGTVTYAPGFAQSLANLSRVNALGPNGMVPLTVTGLQSTLTEVNSEIVMQQQLVATQQAALTAEFTALETTLSQLKAQSSFLTALSNAASGSTSSQGSSGGPSTTGTATTTPGG